MKGSGINDLRRLLFPAKGSSQVDAKRLYDRIFWLERSLLAYERAQLAAWWGRLASETGPRHSRVAHDDVVLGVYCKTTADRRITALNRCVSADIQSGYIFRIDVDFEPTVDPVKFVAEHYLERRGKISKLRKRYEQAGGKAFTAPLLVFQRPSGRFHEPALFASARLHLRLFVEKAEEALSRSDDAVPDTAQAEISEAKLYEDILRVIAEDYFNFPDSERDSPNTFAGIMTHDTYTKAAQFACLGETLPGGKITLVSEQEAAIARVAPHVFREDIRADQFEWHVVSFDKTAKKPAILRRTRTFKHALETFRMCHPEPTQREALENWTAQRLSPAEKIDDQGKEKPYPISNFASKAWPALWLNSPIEAAGGDQKGGWVPDPIAELSSHISPALCPRIAAEGSG